MWLDTPANETILFQHEPRAEAVIRCTILTLRLTILYATQQQGVLLSKVLSSCNPVIISSRHTIVEEHSPACPMKSSSCRLVCSPFFAGQQQCLANSGRQKAAESRTSISIRNLHFSIIFSAWTAINRTRQNPWENQSGFGCAAEQCLFSARDIRVEIFVRPHLKAPLHLTTCNRSFPLLKIHPLMICVESHSFKMSLSSPQRMSFVARDVS